jgi:hypothetical protein
MKHVLSRTSVLFLSAGISLAAATEQPFDKDSPTGRTARAPAVILQSNGKITAIFSDSSDPEKVTVSELKSRPVMAQPSVKGLASQLEPSDDPEARFTQASNEFATEQESQLKKMRAIKEGFDGTKQKREAEQRELEGQIAAKSATLSAYDQYLSTHKVTAGTPLAGQKTISEEISYIDGRLQEIRAASVNQPLPPEVTELEKNRSLLLTDRTALEKEIGELKKKSADAEKISSSLRGRALQEASEVYETLISIKARTPADLSQFPFFDRGEVVTDSEVMVALTEMGIPKALAYNESVARQFFEVGLQNALWPVFSSQDRWMFTEPVTPAKDSSATNPSSESVTPTTATPVQNSNQYVFLKEFKLRSTEVSSRLEENYERTVDGMAALMNQMSARNIPIELNLQPDEFYKHITAKPGLTPDDRTSLFLKSFFKETLFDDPEYDGKYAGVSARLIASLKPTNKNAVLLLTGALMNSPTVKQQLNPRLLPSDEAMRALSFVKAGEQPNPEALNDKLRDAFYELTANRFFMKLNAHTLRRLESIPIEISSAAGK